MLTNTAPCRLVTAKPKVKLDFIGFIQRFNQFGD